MVSGAINIELMGQPKGRPIRFGCVNGVGIPKGTIMKFSGERIVAASAADGDIYAGIAASEKVAGDGSTSIGLDTCAIADINTAENPITLGDMVKISGVNIIGTANDTTAAGGAQNFGVALETGNSSGEVIAVAVGIY